MMGRQTGLDSKGQQAGPFRLWPNYLIDIENAVIVDVEATPARTYDEVAATKTMVKRTDKRMGLKPKYLAADTAYGTGKFLSWLIGAGITPYIPVWDMSEREEKMAPSHAPTSHSTKSTTSTFAPQANCSRQPARCMMAEPFSIVRAPETAAHVLSSLNVLLI
jgi:hypothetical protein